MILITYDGGSRMEVRGHAGTDIKGRDQVCAAVTALTLTLGENCREAGIRSGSAVLSGGNPEIFQAVGRGFALLASHYPHAVHYQCMGHSATNH